MEVIMMPNLLNVASAYFCVKLIRYSLLFWLPFYMIKELGYEVGTAGYSSMMFDVGGIGGAAVTGYISDRIFRGRRLATVCMFGLATAGTLVLFSWASHVSVRATLIVMGMLGFTVAGSDSVLAGATIQDLCERSGHGLKVFSIAAGVVNGMGSSGAVAQGYLTAFVSDRYGWNALFGALCGISCSSIILLIPPVFSEARDRKVSSNPK